MALLDSATRARDSTRLPVRLLLESSPIETNWGEAARFGDAARGGSCTELKLREIKISSLDSFAAEKENLIGFLPKLPFDEEAVVARKLYLPCVTMQEKYVLKTLPRKGCCRLRRWRRVRRELRDNPLNLDVNFLVLATGYSLGIGSKISGDCVNRKRIRMKDFGMRQIGHKSRRSAMRDNGEACILESYFITSDAGGAVSNNKHQIMSMSYDGDQSEDRQSEEVQSAYKSQSGGVFRGYFNLDQSEEKNEENEWSWVPQDGDPLAESVSSLQTTQEALETEMQKLSELSKELGVVDNFSSDNRENNAFISPDEDDVLEMNQKMSHLEQKLEEATSTIRDRDSRLSKLQELIDSAHITTPEKGSFDIDKLEMDLDRQLQEKIEAEIQSVVMLKARQSWQVRAEDQIALKEHKLTSSGSGDGENNARMMIKLRETESKILKLKEQVEKLEFHERELFGTTQMLRMQSRTFKICLFGLVQMILLFVSLKTFFAQVSDPFDDVVPT